MLLLTATLFVLYYFYKKSTAKAERNAIDSTEMSSLQQLQK